MAPRKRIHKNLELNLYQNKVNGVEYYRYKHPKTGKMHGMGTDKRKANAAARILNSKLLQIESSLVDQVLGTNDKDMNYIIGRFQEEILPTKKLAVETMRSYGYRLDRISKDLGEKAIGIFTVEDIAKYLDENFEKSPYVKYRNTLAELFRFAILKGYRLENPVHTTYAKADVVKERQRMTLEQFQSLHSFVPEWMKIAMELALITLQGRHEICTMKYADINDGALFITREKTKKNEWSHLRIEITPGLDAIIKRSRESKIVTPYIVHRRPVRVKDNKEKTHWSQVALNTFTSEFRRLRDSSGIFDSIPSNHRPTFHEIRALGSHLYEKAGYKTEYVQQLMAHGDAKMTEYYQSGHETKWVEVRAELNLNEVFSKK
jgi:integrase